MHFKSIAALSEDLRRQVVSPVEVVDHMLARIAAVDPISKSYVTVTDERAREKAAIAEAEIASGLWRGPLHGVPIALKDIIFTDFAKTTGGTRINRDFQPGHSATVTERLEKAGAIVLGKLKTTEQAFADHHPDVEAPINPFGADRFPGASSSGSGVATAQGLAYGTLGSDTGGSIRLPSAANGLTGLKPTWGRVSRYGVFALGDTFDHIGPMTRSAPDAAIMLAAIAGQDPKDPTALPAPVPDYLAACGAGISGLRIGIPHAFATDGIDAPVVAAFEATAAVLADLGAVLVPVTFPDWRLAVENWTLLCAAEAAWAHRETHPSRKDDYGAVLSGFIELGQTATAVAMAGANISRVEFSAKMATLFLGVDLLLMPTIPTLLPTMAEWLAMASDDFSAYLRFTIPADLTGGPTITFPAGFDGNGLPIAMQFYCPHLSEAALFQAASAFQRLTDWHLRRPAD
jgi:amidase